MPIRRHPHPLHGALRTATRGTPLLFCALLACGDPATAKQADPTPKTTLGPTATAAPDPTPAANGCTIEPGALADRASADAAVRALVERCPRSSFAQTLLGYSLLDQLDVAGAHQAFTAALEVNSDWGPINPQRIAALANVGARGGAPGGEQAASSYAAPAPSQEAAAVSLASAPAPSGEQAAVSVAAAEQFAASTDAQRDQLLVSVLNFYGTAMGCYECEFVVGPNGGVQFYTGGTMFIPGLTPTSGPSYVPNSGTGGTGAPFVPGPFRAGGNPIVEPDSQPETVYNDYQKCRRRVAARIGDLAAQREFAVEQCLTDCEAALGGTYTGYPQLPSVECVQQCLPLRQRLDNAQRDLEAEIAKECSLLLSGDPSGGGGTGASRSAIQVERPTLEQVCVRAGPEVCGMVVGCAWCASSRKCIAAGPLSPGCDR